VQWINGGEQTCSIRLDLQCKSSGGRECDVVAIGDDEIPGMSISFSHFRQRQSQEQKRWLPFDDHLALWAKNRTEWGFFVGKLELLYEKKKQYKHYNTKRKKKEWTALLQKTDHGNYCVD
jgi:hypothetical protein